MTKIYWIGSQPPGVGLRPPMVVPYGIPNGADTIHPALFHGSTCFKIVTDSLGSFISILFLIGWVQTFQPERETPLVVIWKTTISILWKLVGQLLPEMKTDISFIFGRIWQRQKMSAIWYVKKFFSVWEENICYKHYNRINSIWFLSIEILWTENNIWFYT